MVKGRRRIVIAVIGGFLAFLILIFCGESFLAALVRFPLDLWKFLTALPQRLLWAAAVVGVALAVSIRLPLGRMSPTSTRRSPRYLSRWEDLAARIELSPRSRRMREYLARRLAALSSGRDVGVDDVEMERWLERLTSSSRRWRREEFYRVLGNCLEEIRSFERGIDRYGRR